MSKFFRWIWVLALFSILVPFVVTPGDVFAATSANVLINATPSYVTITNAPGDWTINGILGSGRIKTSTTYYSNPLGDKTSPSATVVDGECRFTLTNGSSCATNVTLNIPNFTGGDASTNGNTGTAGATSFGAYGYYSGMTFANKVVAKASGSNVLRINLGATTNMLWGIQLSTQTNDWTSGTMMQSTAVISAADCED